MNLQGSAALTIALAQLITANNCRIEPQDKKKRALLRQVPNKTRQNKDIGNKANKNAHTNTDACTVYQTVEKMLYAVMMHVFKCEAHVSKHTVWQNVKLHWNCQCQVFITKSFDIKWTLWHNVTIWYELLKLFYNSKRHLAYCRKNVLNCDMLMYKCVSQLWKPTVWYNVIPYCQHLLHVYIPTSFNNA